ncbi:hypothetical protein HT102_08150 [Hoyosella sp. G463]|uniref:Peptide chain release factor 1 n=1 Tax=Lolliginicoccus lacisalsi TaxID=2742202 RepID=A0A927JBV8_9ACTN|nr:Vms1/Ankzf1 family peptidyl-tRNA hydrolase [Lolliginicoccus lacisalsi]MBD8506453.1 hypothetical protein [Lolliginicoccus lacisalsi]
MSDLRNRLEEAHGPFLSIYVDDSHNTEDAAKARELRWRDIADRAREQGAPEALIERIPALGDWEQPPIGRRGRALVFSEDTVIVDEELPMVPDQPAARFSPVPHLLPLFEHGVPRQTIMVAEVDRTGVDVSYIDEYGHTIDTRSEDQDHHPVHKANAGDRFSWARVEERTEEMIERNHRETAEHLAAAVRKAHPSMLVLGGEVQARTSIENMLPNDVRALAHPVPEGGRADGASEDGLHEAITDLVRQRQAEKVAEALERFRIESGRSSGYAVDGLSSIAANLQQGNVDTLLVARPLAGEDPSSEVTDTREADAVVATTIRQGGKVFVCAKDDVRFQDGMGAILRAPALAMSDTGASS